MSRSLIPPPVYSTNYPTSAFAGSVTISNAPGSVGDIFSEDQRTVAFSLLCLAPMNGPVLGPIVGGFVYQGAGWRWTNWVVLILAGVLWGLGWLVPETYAPTLMRKKAEGIRKSTGDERYMSRFCHKDGEGDFLPLVGTNLKRPVMMLFTEPLWYGDLGRLGFFGGMFANGVVGNSIFWALYIAVIYGILYLCFTAYPVVFSGIRGWGPGISGLAFCGIGAGNVLATILDPLNNKIYNMHKVDLETGRRPPEARIVLICLAAVLSPAATLWFAWTCAPTSIHWIWPILSGVPYGLGNTWIFVHGNNYLATSYGIYAASALAGNTVCRR